MSFASWLYSQFIFKVPWPEHDFTGQTIIVTGSNTGLGLEAARHLVRLNAAKVILAVRSLPKGIAAKVDIEVTTDRANVIDVCELDLASYKSVKRFADEMAKLPRLDAAILNAGKATLDWSICENNESTITVNVISTMYLAMLLLPILRQSARTHMILPILSIVSSDMHAQTKFAEWKVDDIFETLNNKETADMLDRYNVSKLLSIFAVRSLGSRTHFTLPCVAINVVNPGFCHSELTRDVRGVVAFKFKLLKNLAARTTEEGGRTLVHAISVGWETHGRYLNDCQLKAKSLSAFVRSKEGMEAQRKSWEGIVAQLENIQPGIMETEANYGWTPY